MGLTAQKLNRPRRSRETDEWALVFLMAHRLSAADLARHLKVSIITAKRTIARLRSRGEKIAIVRMDDKTFYEVRDERPWSEIEKDPLLTTVFPGPLRKPRGKAEDADYDAD